ncbi:MAG: hypothetical protein NZM06_10450 [Chloroherpetonaceae bacterium]|nr:hypothetical protein [Chloroherpetonaceae bacterium]MDW8437108.1 hypothetical protein [Chloroherpetonaceae bacterium]
MKLVKASASGESDCEKRKVANGSARRASGKAAMARHSERRKESKGRISNR